MKLASLRLLLLPLLLWECTTVPPAKPPVAQTPPPPATPVPAPVPPKPDDDHRLVSREEFQASPWSPLPAAAGWKALPDGAEVTLTDGRSVRMTFVGTSVVRWWVPAAPGEVPPQPGARYPTDSEVKVIVHEAGGVLSLDSPGLGVRWKLADLSWSLVRGELAILHTAGGPQAAGRRLTQAFSAADAAVWRSPGVTAANDGARAWIAAASPAGEEGTIALPVLFGAGGNLPFAVALDNSYQCYTRVTKDAASVGSLNGGLDVLIAAASRPAGVIEALTAITGRPDLPPVWAHGTALSLPAAETGSFVRRERLAVQTAVGAYRPDRPSFQALVLQPVAAPVPDLTLADTRTAWTALPPLGGLPPGTGIVVDSLPAREDWNTRFDDGGRHSLLARMNNLLPSLVARALSTREPETTLRPYVLARSVGVGTIRSALPEIAVEVGDDGALARLLDVGLAGAGTPAVRLNLTPLARPETKEAAFRSLLSWLLIPELTLDWGPDPAGFWAGLAASDQKRLRALLDLRSQFRPLFDQGARQAEATGRPAWAPLWFAAPSDPRALSATDEVLIGDSLATAPVTGPNRPVYLPGPGVWFDFWSGEEFGGGQTYSVETRPDRPLLFVRGGAFVPVREPETFDDRSVYNPLTMHVFPGGRGTGTYYLDDGVTSAWRSGVAWETRLVYDFEQKQMTLDHEAVNTASGLKADPYLLYRLHNVYRPKQVKIDGKAIPLFGDSWGITDTDRSAAWYESDHTLLVKTFHPEREQNLQILF